MSRHLSLRRNCRKSNGNARSVRAGSGDTEVAIRPVNDPACQPQTRVPTSRTWAVRVSVPSKLGSLTEDFVSEAGQIMGEIGRCQDPDNIAVVDDRESPD